MTPQAIAHKVKDCPLPNGRLCTGCLLRVKTRSLELLDLFAGLPERHQPKTISDYMPQVNHDE
jgi:hypothetical protein